MTKFSESDLVIESLKIIKKYPQGIETKDLLQILRLTLDPSGEDLELLSGRSDDKFSQKVRNLKSHKTLENKGFAKFLENRFYITDDGINFINNNSHQMGDFKLKTLSINILNDWPLSVRTSNALKNENITFVGDLLLYDQNKLLSITNFGRKSLNELEELMKENNINWNSVEVDAPQWFDKREVLLDAIKMKKDKGAYLESNTKGLKSLLRNSDNVSNISSTDKIYIDTNISPAKLEELIISDIDKMLSLLNDKMAFIFKSRFAYKENYKTLEELGKKFGITRERVRQLEVKLKRNLKTFGKIEKASLINYFDKHETVSFHKLFPKLNEYFTNTRFVSMDIAKDKLAIFMESFCGVKEEYFKTAERELKEFSKEQLKEIFTFTPSGVTKDNFLEIIKENYGYSNFVSSLALEFLVKNELIKIQDNKIYPTQLTKIQEVANILCSHPNGLHWKKIAELGNKSFTDNEWDSNRLMSDHSTAEAYNKHIYLCERGTYKLFNLCPVIKNKDQVILLFKNYLQDNNIDQCTLDEAFQSIIKIEEYKNLNFYDARCIIRKFGPEISLFFLGRSTTNTIGLKKITETSSLNNSLLEIFQKSSDEVLQKDLEKKFSTFGDSYVDSKLNSLVSDLKIFKMSPGVFLNFNSALKLCDVNEVQESLVNYLDKYLFLTNGFIREEMNKEFGYGLSNLYYNSLTKFLAKENNWFYSSNYLSKKIEKQKNLENYIKDRFKNNLSNNENYELISKEIGVSRRSYDNIVYQFNINFNTEWVHQND